jgi:hypothetical protein
MTSSRIKASVKAFASKRAGGWRSIPEGGALRLSELAHEGPARSVEARGGIGCVEPCARKKRPPTRFAVFGVFSSAIGVATHVRAVHRY